MSTFEFVTVLLSIVVGLGITRLLGGLGRAIEIRGSFRGYCVQTLWSVTVGLWFLVFWWVVVFSYQDYERWVFVNFIHLLLYATLLFLLSVLIIPRDLKPGTVLLPNSDDRVHRGASRCIHGPEWSGRSCIVARGR